LLNAFLGDLLSVFIHAWAKQNLGQNIEWQFCAIFCQK
jgi:hypothetical protein